MFKLYTVLHANKQTATGKKVKTLFLSTVTEALQIHILTWQRADPELRAAEEVMLQCSWGHFHI